MSNMLSRPFVEPMDRERLLTEILKGVSRSFYLSIRVLPPNMRQPVAVAYLLARAADTIADTQALPPSKRLEQLLAFRAQVVGPALSDAVANIVKGVKDHSDGVSPEERSLLQSAEDLFALLESLPDCDQERVRRVVITLTLGMELDLRTFPAEDSGELGVLNTPDDLDCYTYLVAGCVGEFWTSVAKAHEPRLAGWNTEEMTVLGVRFGKALQLTNVLRDIPRDLRIGRCYLPENDLAAEGLAPADLMGPANASRARSVLMPWIRTALAHFNSAESYVLCTPRRCFRMRLAALWPILLGLATLEKLARNDAWLDPARPSRVKRRWVYGMMARSLLAVGSDTLLRLWIRGLRRKVEQALCGK